MLGVSLRAKERPDSAGRRIVVKPEAPRTQRASATTVGAAQVSRLSEPVHPSAGVPLLFKSGGLCPDDP